MHSHYCRMHGHHSPANKSKHGTSSVEHVFPIQPAPRGWGRAGVGRIPCTAGRHRNSSASCPPAWLHAYAQTGAHPSTGPAGRADPVRHVAAELLGVLPAIHAGRCRPERRAPRRLGARRQDPAQPGARSSADPFDSCGRSGARTARAGTLHAAAPSRPLPPPPPAAAAGSARSDRSGLIMIATRQTSAVDACCTHRPSDARRARPVRRP